MTLHDLERSSREVGTPVDLEYNIAKTAGDAI